MTSVELSVSPEQLLLSMTLFVSLFHCGVSYVIGLIDEEIESHHWATHSGDPSPTSYDHPFL